MQYQLKLRKGVRGTTNRELVTSGGTIRMEGNQKDVIFEHSGDKAPVLRDLDVRRTVLNEADVDFSDVTVLEQPQPQPKSAAEIAAAILKKE